MIALGRIQAGMGPDTRVSANADLLGDSVEHPHWVGVWKTRVGTNGERFFVDHHHDERYLTDVRTQGDGSQAKPPPLTWLVSSPTSDAADPLDSPTEEWVTLLRTPTSAGSVEVPRVPIDSDSRGGFAWWVSDESQKALVSEPWLPGERISGVNGDPAAFHTLAAASGFRLQQFRQAEGAIDSATPEEEQDRSRILQLDMLPQWSPASGIDPDVLKESFHDLTTTSNRLFTNTAEGGLKLDLTAFLELGDQVVSGPNPDSLPELRESDPILPGAHHAKTSPRFGALKGWWDLAFALDSDSGQATIDARNPTLRAVGNTHIAGKERDLTNVREPALQPVVVEISQGYDFSPYTPTGSSDEFIRSHVYPRVILWNPFNVSLSTERMLALIPTPQYIQMTFRGEERENYYFDRLFGLSGAGRKNIGYVIPPTTFAPGETKVFSPDVSASTGPYLFGRAARLDPGNYSNNVLTGESPPGVDNFYWDTIDEKNKLVPETDENRNEPYGPTSGDMFSWKDYEGNYVLYEAPGTGDLTWNSLPTLTKISDFRTQNRGDGIDHKWFGPGGSDTTNNAGHPFREFIPGAADIGALENRSPPRLWRKGVKMAWYEETLQRENMNANLPPARFSPPLVATYNLRGGILQHSDWLTLDAFAWDWQHVYLGSHYYFRIAADSKDFATNSFPSPVADPFDFYPSRVVLYDIPREANGIVSLGQLQHAQLSYNNWHPSFILGNSWSTANADLDATAIKSQVGDGGQPWQDAPSQFVQDRNKSASWDQLVQIGGGTDEHDNEVLIFDIAFEVNRAIWDRFFLSSIPFGGSPGARQPDWTPGDPLPVGRFDFDSSLGQSAGEVAARIDEDLFLFHHAAEFLVNRGGFNVNSTSEEAWKALLFSLRGLARPALSGGLSEGDHPFSRSLINGEPGNPAIDGKLNSKTWRGFRSLTDSEVEDLAKEIVQQVKLRGPFLSLSDFVNRRLSLDEAISRAGALDAAINRTGINNDLETGDGASVDLSSDRAYNTPEGTASNMTTLPNRVDFKTVGLPGYFSQADLLTPLAPALSVRGDTFVIRAYGYTSETGGGDEPAAEAWCEAVVQRNPPYVDQGNGPSVPPYTRSTDGSLSPNSALAEINRTFGRAFEVVSFRWLSEDEI